MNGKKLIPRTAAGRANRRARAFSSEIARLRREGYGYVAIQEALADAGVADSKSTVQREVARIARAAPSNPGPAPPAAKASAIHAPVAPEPSPIDDERLSAKDIAKAYMKDQITNPLFRNRS